MAGRQQGARSWKEGEDVLRPALHHGPGDPGRVQDARDAAGGVAHHQALLAPHQAGDEAEQQVAVREERRLPPRPACGGRQDSELGTSRLVGVRQTSPR